MKKHQAKQCAPQRNYEMIVKEKGGRRLKKREKGLPEKITTSALDKEHQK